MAWAYLLAVFVLREGATAYALWLALTLGAWLASILLLRALIVQGRLSRAALRGPILAVWVSLLCVVVLDVGYSVFLYLLGRDTQIQELAEFDPHSLTGEVYPRLYHPTERNFRLHKPNYQVTVTTYGAFYSPAMLRSPTLVAEVLQAHPVTIVINDHGLREELPLEGAHIFALGDSLTFGWGIDAELSWVKVLERLIDCPVYNLGVKDSSPKQEFELLAYLLKTHSDAIRIRRLIWAIYEGNDLKGSYANESPQARSSLPRWLMADTLLGPLANLPLAIKNGAVLSRLMRNEIRLVVPGAAGQTGHHEVDGVILAYELYRSPKFGARLFHRPYLKRVNAPAAYVLEHPNRPRLDRVFDQMRALSERHGFEVTVVLAPTAARLHGRFYDDFPPIVEPPHFLNYVGGLAQRMGFETVDLHRLMQPVAGERLLYFTDDDHWNEAGNALAADLIAQQAFADHPPCPGAATLPDAIGPRS